MSGTVFDALSGCAVRGLKPYDRFLFIFYAVRAGLRDAGGRGSPAEIAGRALKRTFFVTLAAHCGRST